METCVKCRKPIKEGEGMEYFPGLGEYPTYEMWIHKDCFDKPVLKMEENNGRNQAG